MDEISKIDVGWLAQKGPCKAFTSGQNIPCTGSSDAERSMYVLLVGRVEVTQAGGKAADSISYLPGDVFGGLEFFTDKVENVYTAAINSVAYVISEGSFKELASTRPDILFEIFRAAYFPQGIPTDQVNQAEEKEKQSAPVKTKEDAEDASDKPSQAAETPQAEKSSEPQKAVAPTIAMAAASGKTPEAVKAAAPSEGEVFPQGHKSYPGVTKPSYARLVYAKEYTCPFCKKTFKDFKVFSSKLHESAPMRFDLRRFYTDFQLEWYDVITCSHCYFSAVSSFIADGKPVLKQKIENELAAGRESVLLDFEAQRDIDYVFTSHYLALLCADGYLSSAIPVRAKLWGNLSWLYEDVEDGDMERFAAEMAADAYEEVYTRTRMTPVQEQTTCLSIAGMQRRAGIDRNLRKYLFQVKTIKSGDKAYINIAEDIMEDMRANGSQ